MGLTLSNELSTTPFIPSIQRTNKNGRIKIGQIGVCHEHASGKIEALRKLPDLYEIVGIVDDRKSTAAKRAGDDLRPYKGLTWMTEEELFRVPGLQAVAVEVPNADLVPTAIRCMQHNLSMHMDKPGGEDLALFEELLTGCEQRKLAFQMGYMFRGHPAFQFCKKAIRQQWLGDIFEIQADMSHDYGGASYQEYISHFKGGIMFNLGCHHFDFIVSVLGAPQRITPFLGSTQGASSNAKNNTMAILEYPHALVSVSACDIKVNGIARRSLRINGSKGSIELSPLERLDGKPVQLQLILKEGNSQYAAGTHTIDCGIQTDRYTDQFIELAKIIKGEMENPYTCRHDYLTQKVTLAASGYINWDNR